MNSCPIHVANSHKVHGWAFGALLHEPSIPLMSRGHVANDVDGEIVTNDYNNVKGIAE